MFTDGDRWIWMDMGEYVRVRCVDTGDEKRQPRFEKQETGNERRETRDETRETSDGRRETGNDRRETRDRTRTPETRDET